MGAERSSFKQGVIPVAGAAALWAAGYFFRKTVFYGISPILVASISSMIVVVIFLLSFKFRISEIYSAFLKAPWRYIGLGFSGVALGTTFMFLALDRLDLGVTLILEKLQPIFTIFLARIFIGEKIATRTIPYVVVAIVASYFVCLPNPLQITANNVSIVGIICVTLAALSWAAATVIGRSIVLIESDSRKVTLLRFATGAIFLLPVIFFYRSLDLKLDLDVYVLSVLVLCSIFSTGLGYILFYRGLKHVTAAVSGFVELITPVIGLILGVVFLGETFSTTQLLAIPVLLWSIYKLT